LAGTIAAGAPPGMRAPASPTVPSARAEAPAGREHVGTSSMTQGSVVRHATTRTAGIPPSHPSRLAAADRPYPLARESATSGPCTPAAAALALCQARP
jgi:hypothetical protein